jgi:hypothetical protein
MKSSRAATYGRNLGKWVEETINSQPEAQREGYKARFLNELKTYSFETRKNGQPPNSGCKNELSDIVECDINDPEQLAKLVKEGIHLMYQKGTSARVLNAMTKYLSA